MGILFLFRHFGEPAWRTTRGDAAAATNTAAATTATAAAATAAATATTPTVTAECRLSDGPTRHYHESEQTLTGHAWTTTGAVACIGARSTTFTPDAQRQLQPYTWRARQPRPRSRAQQAHQGVAPACDPRPPQSSCP